MAENKAVGWTHPACRSFADKMKADGYATFSVRILKAENISGGTVTLVGLPTDTCQAGERGDEHDGAEVCLPNGVLGNLGDACNHVGCWIDLAIRADYANGNNDLVPYAWLDDVEHFGLQCDAKG